MICSNILPLSPPFTYPNPAILPCHVIMPYPAILPCFMSCITAIQPMANTLPYQYTWSTAMPCHTHNTCHANHTVTLPCHYAHPAMQLHTPAMPLHIPCHATHMPTYAKLAPDLVGCHSAFPSTGPGERMFQDIWILLTVQASLCTLFFTLTFVLMLTLPYLPPPTPRCLPRLFF